MKKWKGKKIFIPNVSKLPLAAIKGFLYDFIKQYSSTRISKFGKPNR